jgi:hypothetical protein
MRKLALDGHAPWVMLVMRKGAGHQALSGIVLASHRPPADVFSLQRSGPSAAAALRTLMEMHPGKQVVLSQDGWHAPGNAQEALRDASEFQGGPTAA